MVFFPARLGALIEAGHMTWGVVVHPPRPGSSRHVLVVKDWHAVQTAYPFAGLSAQQALKKRQGRKIAKLPSVETIKRTLRRYGFHALQGAAVAGQPCGDESSTWELFEHAGGVAGPGVDLSACLVRAASGTAATATATGEASVPARSRKKRRRSPDHSSDDGVSFGSSALSSAVVAGPVASAYLFAADPSERAPRPAVTQAQAAARYAAYAKALAEVLPLFRDEHAAIVAEYASAGMEAPPPPLPSTGGGGGQPAAKRQKRGIDAGSLPDLMFTDLAAAGGQPGPFHQCQVVPMVETPSLAATMPQPTVTVEELVALSEEEEGSASLSGGGVVGCGVRSESLVAAPAFAVDAVMTNLSSPSWESLLGELVEPAFDETAPLDLFGNSPSPGRAPSAPMMLTDGGLFDAAPLGVLEPAQFELGGGRRQFEGRQFDGRQFDGKLHFDGTQQRQFDGKLQYDGQRNFDGKRHYDGKRQYDRQLHFDGDSKLDGKLQYDRKLRFDGKLQYDRKLRFDGKLQYDRKLFFDGKRQFDGKLHNDRKLHFDGKRHFDGKLGCEASRAFEAVALYLATLWRPTATGCTVEARVTDAGSRCLVSV